MDINNNNTMKEGLYLKDDDYTEYSDQDRRSYHTDTDINSINIRRWTMYEFNMYMVKILLCVYIYFYQ
jgi:hypothetical protein